MIILMIVLTILNCTNEKLKNRITNLTKGKQENDLLIKAVENNDVSMFKKVIKSVDDVNITDDYGRNLLIIAASNCNTEIMYLLTDKKLNIDINSVHSGNTILTIATNSWYQELKENFAKVGLENERIYSTDEEQKNIVEHLLKLGADPNFCDTFSNPLYFAVLNGLEKVVQVLLNNGADPSFKFLSDRSAPLGPFLKYKDHLIPFAASGLNVNQCDEEFARRGRIIKLLLDNSVYFPHNIIDSCDEKTMNFLRQQLFSPQNYKIYYSLYTIEEILNKLEQEIKELDQTEELSNVENIKEKKIEELKGFTLLLENNNDTEKNNLLDIISNNINAREALVRIINDGHILALEHLFYLDIRSINEEKINNITNILNTKYNDKTIFMYILSKYLNVRREYLSKMNNHNNDLKDTILGLKLEKERFDNFINVIKEKLNIFQLSKDSTFNNYIFRFLSDKELDEISKISNSKSIFDLNIFEQNNILTSLNEKDREKVQSIIGILSSLHELYSECEILDNKIKEDEKNKEIIKERDKCLYLISKAKAFFDNFI
jgi:ankyrin repeat protein